MTAQLPPNLLALFSARPPLRYLPPADHAPEDRRTHPITGVAQYLDQLKAKQDPDDYKPTESWLEKRDRKMLEKQEYQKYITGEGAKVVYNPKEDPNIRGDPFRTLFVGRLPYETDIKDLEREFSRFGPIDRIRIVTDNGESLNDPKRANKKSRKGKSRGYGFIIFENEKDMKGTDDS